jgi:16S rRNA G527 N7-methylase RsmG
MEPVRSAPLSGSQDVIGSGAGVPGLYEKMKLLRKGLR